MSAPASSHLISDHARRSADQAIGYLMEQGIQNPDCLSLAAGFVDPETLPVDLVRDVSNRLLSDSAAARQALQYGTTAGSEDLRAVFRNYLAQLEGPESCVDSVPLDQFVLTTGSQQLLCLLAQVLFNPGDICLVAAPTYFVFLGVLDAVGAQVIPVETDDDGMCPQALEKQLASLQQDGLLSRVRMVYVVSYFDNPAGITVSSERRPLLVETVRRWSRDHVIYLLEDAAYRELTFDAGTAIPSVWSFDSGYREGSQQHVILAQTFSKSFSPGLRVGHGILPAELVKPVTDLKGNEDFGSAHFCQRVMGRVLQDGLYRDHCRLVRDGYRRKRDAMLQAADEYFSDIEGVTWRRPNGGLYVWMSLPQGVETGFSSALFRRATDVEKVMYVPGELCYPSGWSDRPRHQMRLSFGVLPVDQIREGMRRLAAAVRAVIAEM